MMGCSFSRTGLGGSCCVCISLYKGEITASNGNRNLNAKIVYYSQSGDLLLHVWLVFTLLKNSVVDPNPRHGEMPLISNS